MAVRFRPWDPKRRFVCRVPAAGGRPGSFRRRWLAIHEAPPEWARLFARALDLMLVDASEDAGRRGSEAAGSLSVGSGAGGIIWNGRTRYTVITLELWGFSARKQALIATAIAKAARYEMPVSAERAA